MAARMTSDLRRRQILEAAKGCFARHGFAGTTTKSLAAAAGISEGLLFKHFSTKATLYAEILAESCEADPALNRLLELEPSTATLVEFVRSMVRHFLAMRASTNREEAQRLRLMISSHLDDGEFARLLFEKVGHLVAPIFVASLERAVAAGDAIPVKGKALDLFWYGHHMIQMVALTRLPASPALTYPKDEEVEHALCDFILRGIGLTGPAIAAHFDSKTSTNATQHRIAESA